MVGLLLIDEVVKEELWLSRVRDAVGPDFISSKRRLFAGLDQAGSGFLLDDVADLDFAAHYFGFKVVFPFVGKDLYLAHFLDRGVAARHELTVDRDHIVQADLFLNVRCTAVEEVDLLAYLNDHFTFDLGLFFNGVRMR